MRTFSRILLLSALAVLLSAPGLSAQEYDYDVIDLGAIAYDVSRGHDINELGQVTGDTLNADGNWRAFVWTSGSMFEVPALTGYAGDYGYGYGINIHGQVAGESGYTNPFLWDGTTTIVLGNLGGMDSGAAHALNDSTQVVGYASHSGGYDHAFLWENGVMNDLGVLSGSGWGRSEARDINNAGQVVGVSASDTDSHAFLWENGVMTDLGGLGPGYSIAYAISESGFIVGSSTAPPPSYRTHATLWTGGSVIDLGTLIDPDPGASEARDMNDAGQIVGWSNAHNTFNRHAFLFEAGIMRDLNDLIDPNSGWELQEAYGINEQGQIVGYGDYQGHLRGFLLQPTTDTRDTLDVDIACMPDSGVLPFGLNLWFSLQNRVPENRVMAARLEVTIASGATYPNFRNGYTNLEPDELFTISWVQTLPALGGLVGANTFNLVGEDVTPAPYNQPPFSPSGDTGLATCTVTGAAP